MKAEEVARVAAIYERDKDKIAEEKYQRERTAKRAELGAKTMTSLVALAATMELGSDDIDAAMGDKDDPKAGLIALMAP